MMSEEYSCILCDTTILIERRSEPAVVVCAECGGEAVAGLQRMCPVCHSRNTKITKVEVYLD